MTPTPSPGPDSNAPHEELPERSSALAWRDPASDGADASRDALRARSEENTTRELYARLINLLSQDAEKPAEAIRKSPLEGALGLVRRRWLPMLLVLALASFGLSRVLKPGPPLYSATASMLLPPVAGPGKGGSAALDDGSDTVSRQYDTETQIAIITSPRIVNRAIARLTPEEKIAGWGSELLSNSNVGVRASSLTAQDIINITVTSLNSASSKRLANVVGGIYKLDTFERTSQAREQDVTFVSRQAEEARVLLARAQDRLRDFKEKSGVNSATAAIASSEQNIQSLQAAAEAARVEAEAGLGSQTISGDAQLASLRQAAQAARSRLDALRVDFQDTSPRVVKAQGEYQTAQQAAEGRAASLLASLQRRAQVARSQLDAARQASQSLPGVESQLGKLNGDVERLNTTYNTISQRLGSANLSRNAYIAVPDFNRPATLDSQPFGERTKFLALSILGGLLAAGLAGLILERADRGVHSREDLLSIIEAPVLGSLPALGRKSEARLTHLSAGRGRATTEAALLEASHKLRSRIIEAAYKNGVRSLLITSPEQSEGKSLCALNVAAALAFDGHRVLLVDTDFWNPAQHRLAEAPLSPGYSDVLAQTCEVEAAMRASKVRNLWILPAGARPANIGDLAGGTRNRQQLKAFEQAFEFVIIDSPPTLSLGDAQVLSGLADAVALVVADATPREEVQRAEAVLRLTGARLLGVILNNDKSRSRGSTHSSPSSHLSDGPGDIGAGPARLPGSPRPAPPLEAHRD